MYSIYLLVKSCFDKIISLICIIVLSPIMISLGILILLVDKQSPIFIQERSGIYGKKISILKFRTMRNLNNKVYVTLLGKILRKTKLDEIPQLINIFIGDLSFVGPRPLYIDFNNYYSSLHKKRLIVKPGLTGLAQIRVMNSADWRRKFNFDCIYIKKQSFKLDMYILYKTFTYILFLFFKNKGKEHIEIYDYKENFFNYYVKKAPKDK